MTKAQLRRAMKEILAGIGPESLAAGSRAAARRLAGSPAWSGAGLVLCFLSMPGELDTTPIIGAARAQGKQVAVPRIEGNLISFRLLGADPASLPRDRWEIPVPDPSWPEVDLAAAGSVLVAAPGLAFDRRGNRLGRGGGYYDGFLRTARARAVPLTVVGVCLSVQLVAEVPHDAHDEPVDAVATDEELILRAPG
jgi:5-formyltetrahydrofolate cyclo-ligase